jgi:hypothetical protein
VAISHFDKIIDAYFLIMYNCKPGDDAVGRSIHLSHMLSSDRNLYSELCNLWLLLLSDIVRTGSSAPCARFHLTNYTLIKYISS